MPDWSRGRVQTENNPLVPAGSRLSLGPIPPSRKKEQITETLISQLNECYLGSSTTTCQTPEDEFIRWDDDGRTGARPIRKEAGTLIKSFANPKKMLRIGNWNVRTMYSVGKTAQVVKEMQRYNLDILGISECRWFRSGRLKDTDWSNYSVLGKR